MSLKIKRHDLFVILLIFMLPISEFFVSIFDELLAIFAILFLAYEFALHRIEKEEKNIIFILISIIVLGITSNIISTLVTDCSIIAFDVLEFCKVIVVFLAARLYFKNKEILSIARKISFIAKIIIIVAFILAVISQFGDIGMTMRHADGKIYPELGIVQPFGFYTKNGIQTYYLLSGCLLFVLVNSKNTKKNNIYTFLYFVTNVLTGANLVWVADILFLSLYLYYKKNKKLKVRTLVLIAVVVLIVALPAIYEYLFDLKSPRIVLLYYGFLTAKSYFPIGSGFATYGGEIAARYYSPLYWKYGFDGRYGLSHSGYGGLLNDNYVAMIVAQFGYVGLVLYIFLYYKIFKILDFKTVSRKIKPLTISIFGTMVCSMMISATSKTLMGVWIYAILGICSTMNKEEITSYE